MSDSSDEDMSKFRSVVDTSFLDTLCESNKYQEKKKSERYLQESSHYNDVKVPEELQQRIGAQVSALIAKKIEFVECPLVKIRKLNVKGGVKLFKTSTDWLSCEDVVDKETELHNIRSKKLKHMKRTLNDEEILYENDKIKAVAICGDYILSQEDTRHWKSRRKEKLYRYKSIKNSNKLLSVD